MAEDQQRSANVAARGVGCITRRRFIAFMPAMYLVIRLKNGVEISNPARYATAQQDSESKEKG
ncbi:MAG: hypothetical protein OXC17_06930 [Aestuariivita sp.]|nr:hypothetical protein [Aestuariivita sp.]